LKGEAGSSLGKEEEMQKKIIVLLCLAFTICLFNPTLTLAGSSYELKCGNKNCNYTEYVNLGGGFAFEQITGYCVKCGKFVYLKWRRKGSRDSELSGREPTPVGHVWCPSTGQTKPLYKCPECSEFFLPIDSVQELRFCPRCKQSKLKSKETMCYD
jgi:DNA-directed RNA polymerase subunit RPC12/RpoP